MTYRGLLLETAAIAARRAQAVTIGATVYLNRAANRLDSRWKERERAADPR